MYPSAPFPGVPTAKRSPELQSSWAKRIPSAPGAQLQRAGGLLLHGRHGSPGPEVPNPGQARVSRWPEEAERTCEKGLRHGHSCFVALFFWLVRGFPGERSPSCNPSQVAVAFPQAGFGAWAN